LGKILEILGKIPENPNKTLKYQAKSLKIWAKIAPNVFRKTSGDYFWSSHQKAVRKSWKTTFWAGLGKFGQKSFAHPKICLLLHVWTR